MIKYHLNKIIKQLRLDGWVICNCLTISDFLLAIKLLLPKYLSLLLIGIYLILNMLMCLGDFFIDIAFSESYIIFELKEQLMDSEQKLVLYQEKVHTLNIHDLHIWWVYDFILKVYWELCISNIQHNILELKYHIANLSMLDEIEQIKYMIKEYKKNEEVWIDFDEVWIDFEHISHDQEQIHCAVEKHVMIDEPEDKFNEIINEDKFNEIINEDSLIKVINKDNLVKDESTLTLEEMQRVVDRKRWRNIRVEQSQELKKWKEQLKASDLAKVLAQHDEEALNRFCEEELAKQRNRYKGKRY